MGAWLQEHSRTLLRLAESKTRPRIWLQRRTRPPLARSLPSGYLSGGPFRGAIAVGEGHMGRIFGFLSVVIVMGIGMYLYSKQIQSSSAAAGATSPQAAINITGVKSDLINIASAERRYFASEVWVARRSNLDELRQCCPAASALCLCRRGQFRFQWLSRNRNPYRRQHLWHARATFSRREHGVPNLPIALGPMRVFP